MGTRSGAAMERSKVSGIAEPTLAGVRPTNDSNGFVNRRSPVQSRALALGSKYSYSHGKASAGGGQNGPVAAVSADTYPSVGQRGAVAHVSGYAFGAALDVVISLGADVARAVRR